MQWMNDLRFSSDSSNYLSIRYLFLGHSFDNKTREKTTFIKLYDKVEITKDKYFCAKFEKFL